MKLSIASLAGICLALYCLVCWYVLEKRNSAVPGGVLQQYHEEYADGGSKKWRFSLEGDDPGMPLHDFITTFGWVVYPVAIFGIIFFGVQAMKRVEFRISLAIVVVCGVVLLRFVQLGVWSAAWEL
jgi:hypothetical protein